MCIVERNMGNIFIRQAVKKDIPAIEEMYRRRVRYNDAHGIHQWYEEEVCWEAFQQLYTIEDYYVGVREGVIVCGLFIVDVDVLYWEDCPPKDALYLHKICVHPDHRGKGYADDMITFFKWKAHKEGYRQARLDVRDYKDKLRAMYERHGFEMVAIKKVHPEFQTVLYEYAFT